MVQITFATPKEISKSERAIHVTFLIVGVAILAYVLTTINIAEITTAFGVLGLNMLVLAALLVMVLVIKSLRLMLLMRKIASVPFHETFKIVFETALFSIYSPMKAGEVTKLDLFKKHGISRTQSMSAIILERTYDLAVVTMLSAGMLFSFGVDLILLFTAGVIAVAAVAALYKFGVLGGIVAKLVESIKTLLDAKTLAITLVLTLALWMADASMPYFALRVLGYDVRIDILIPIYFASTIIGLISMIPGGLGASDFSFSYGLTALAGVPEADALATILASRIVTFLVCLVGSMFYFVEMRRVIKNG